MGASLSISNNHNSNNANSVLKSDKNLKQGIKTDPPPDIPSQYFDTGAMDYKNGVWGIDLYGSTGILNDN